MIRFIILGFLTCGQFTGYDIRQMMTYSTSNFMSASFGSIYPALNKLEKEGLISSTKVIENGRFKKVYTINKTGEEEFMTWLEEPIDFMRSYEDILAKVFFYGKLPKEKIKELLEQLINDINKKIEELQNLETMIKNGAGHFEISTLYFGIDHLKFMADWYRKFANDLNSI
ncbi:DNA-binding transcriptional regulator, PadR family [Proteiniborus ethanoligenes]|uniref:DNA-binding transcriptional regulator, PadR family n=1 Tax=Proteiniborus ethanoligenes TaxID=415015 RepID=A0A1H3MU49_9FIRM|nr:PadR family transcriptional regulator [Proteiniborus ethanoligenes]SDY80106.1 DNA-binding transcriptional regulator, PadR family [Proteiniborus ethanoligenes]